MNETTIIIRAIGDTLAAERALADDLAAALNRATIDATDTEAYAALTRHQETRQR